MWDILKKILVIAPHTDDGELGMAGTIAKLIDHGVEVYYCGFSIAEAAVPKGFPKEILADEVKEATKSIGILEKNLTIHRFPVRCFSEHRQAILQTMIDLKIIRDYDAVFIPSINDIHQDHQVIAQEAIRAFKNTSILSYELPWNNLTFNNTCFVQLEKQYIEKKIRAINMYQSQAHQSYMAPDFIEGLARVRGTQINILYAEVFEVVRWIIK